jgi:hypothetical protein
VTDAVWWDLPDEVVRFKIAPDKLKEAAAGWARSRHILRDTPQ